MSFHRFAAELSLVTLTLWLQSAGVAALIAWVRRALQGDMHIMGAFRLAALCATGNSRCRFARIGDYAVGRFLSLAFLTVVGLGGLLLGKQLFNSWLQ